MAVKVMVAPTIAKGEDEKPARVRRAPAAGEPQKPRRRRSSVYDADGNEVFITLMCLKCHKMRPLSQFGLRRMADGAIRNQPWCRTCRSAAGTGRGRGKGAAETVESPVAVEPLAEPQEAAAVESARPNGKLAAEVAAALAAGLGR
jgi:hypothetical protein